MWMREAPSWFISYLENPRIHSVLEIDFYFWRVNGSWHTILKSPDHTDFENIREKFQNWRRRMKIRFLSGKIPDFRRIRIFSFETGLIRQAIEFCVEKW